MPLKAIIRKTVDLSATSNFTNKKQQTLRIITYDEDYAKHLKIETKEWRLSKRWLCERCISLQASTFGRICKATKCKILQHSSKAWQKLIRLVKHRLSMSLNMRVKLLLSMRKKSHMS